jgi:hypothetical protein
MQWFRFYDEALQDPKVQRLEPVLFKHWVNLLCVANQGKPRGTLPRSLEDLAFSLRVSEEEMTGVLIRLSESGLLVRDDEGRWRPHNWDARQFKSDDINARVRAHRERNVTSPAGETLHATLHVTPPDTDTDTDTETEQSVRAPTAPSPTESSNGKKGEKMPRKKRPTPLPEDWDTQQDWDSEAGLFAWARRELQLGPERINAETDKFLDYWRARGDSKADWTAAWRFWMRSSTERRRV